MKRIGIFLLTGLFFSFTQAFCQEEPKDPDEQIIVNKRYDENGNLIQYDSTYVHQWSTDSTFQFGNPGNGYFSWGGTPEMEEFFKNFMNDSTAYFGFPYDFGVTPFEGEDFWEHFNQYFPDSSGMNNFSFGTDSSFNQFKTDSLGMSPQSFMSPGFEEMQKFFNEEFGGLPPGIQEFNNPQQREEWEQLMEKHQQELEEFRKKWEGNN